MLRFPLYNENFVSNFIDVMYPCLFLLSVVGNSVLSVLLFEELQIDFNVLLENHVHPKSEMAWIVRQVQIAQVQA